MTKVKGRIIEHEGKKYIQVGDKAIPFDSVDENGNPVIKAQSEVKKYPDGRQDVTVKVPCLRIAGKSEIGVK